MSANRCAECGVELKPGLKYCDFCGEKVPEQAAAAPVAASPGREACGRAGAALKGAALLCLVVGMLAYVGNRLQGGQPAPEPPAAGPGGKHQAAAACEDAIRARAPAPFRVIAFPATRIAETRGGYAVSGSVDLQSIAGDLQRRRYFCRVRPDGSDGMSVDEGRLY